MEKIHCQFPFPESPEWIKPKNFQISARADGRKAWRGRLGRVEICRNQTLIDITVWQFDADIQRIRSRLRIAAVTIVLSVRISQQRVGRAPPSEVTVTSCP